jgi:hypothetical protein
LETHDWWPELVAMKDTLSLRELAEKFDVTPGAISAALKRSGMNRKPAPPGPRALRKRDDEDDDLPPEIDEVEEAGADDDVDGDDSGDGLSARPGSKDHLILAIADLLGKVPDAEVARRSGVSVRTVASFRARNKIAAFGGAREEEVVEPAGRKSRIEPFQDLLGRVTDRTVADKAGVSINAVRHYRHRLGIKAVQSSDMDEVATPAPAPRAPVAARPVVRPVASSGSSAWLVTFRSEDDETQRVVLAGSMVGAAEAAASGGLGDVVAIEWLAETL